MKLNCGCGPHYAEGWLNIDLTVEAGRSADQVADVRALPFDDESFTHVYAGHVLEHLPLEDVPQALFEIRRVLAAGGQLMVVGPDIERARAQGDEPVVESINGRGEARPGDSHKWSPTGPQTLSICRSVFPDAYEPAITAVSAEWPVVGRATWQFAVCCPKRLAT